MLTSPVIIQLDRAVVNMDVRVALALSSFIQAPFLTQNDKHLGWW